ncbi:helix-turn-helix domain-containing protein [Halomarina rubra]|uniref:Helix-turn-helix domain-containing protein n=1 Tax=Halomarina rubra TaxID=2071873 RepID=A0ABD6AUW9_9EURY|nr:helix-turn-helix domain-containing protein [Halomarina rubra]
MVDDSIIAEIRTESPKQIFYGTTRAVPDATIETRYHAATDQDIPYLFYAVRCEDFGAFDAALAEDPSVADPVVVVDGGSDADRLYRVEPTPELLVVPVLTRHGGAMLSAYCRDGAWTGRYQFPGREALVTMREFCCDNGLTFDVQRLYRADDAGDWGDAGLTDRQREALLAAYEAGYFDEPRLSSLEDIASTLDISATAVGRRLRRGTAGLVEAVLGGDRDRI